MPHGPAFLKARIVNDALEVSGRSNPPFAAATPPFEEGTVVEIKVGVQLGTRFALKLVDALERDWTATFPLKDPSTPDPATNFAATRTVLAFGVETRIDPFTACTWTEILTID